MSFDIVLFNFAVVEGGGNSNSDLSIEESCHWDKQTPCIVIRSYQQSPLSCMFNSGENQALLNSCGVDHKVYSGHFFKCLNLHSIVLCLMTK